MELNDLQRAFLSALYEVRFVNFGGALEWEEWSLENGYSVEDVDHCFDILRENSLVEPYALGRVANITTQGALFVEEQGLFDTEVINHHQQFRTRFLLALADVRDEHGIHAAEDWEIVINKIGATDTEFLCNYDILRDGGYVDNQSVRTFYITSFGYEAVQEHREAVKHQQEFERLRSASGMLVSERETAFVALLKSKCIKDGWQCEMVALEAEGAETLIVYRDLNFFVSSCVWAEEELSRSTVRKLREQIASRPGTNGCIFSMSPVSVDAISEAQIHLNTACIIIFGKEDLSELFHGGTLTEAVDAKMVNARIRRSITAK